MINLTCGYLISAFQWFNNNATSCKNSIKLLWSKYIQGNPFLPEEITLIKLYGASSCSSGQVYPTLIDDLAASPQELNKKFVRAHKTYSKQKAHGKHDYAFEEGLVFFKSLSFGLHQLQENQSALKGKIIRILENIDSLQYDEKLTKHEVYVLYLAVKIQEQYQEIEKKHLATQSFTDFFSKNTEFFQNAKKIVDNCWKDLEIDSKTLLFFLNSGHSQAMNEPISIMEPLKNWLRRGDELHVALLGNWDGETPKQYHITYDNYEENPIRVIDLLSSRFVSLDLTKFLSAKGTQIVQEIAPGLNENDYLYELWTKKFKKVVKDTEELKKIKNSNLRKYMCVLKWFGAHNPNEVIDGKNKPSHMICSEFAICLMSRIIDKMEKSVIKQYRMKNSSQLNHGELFQNHFASMNARSMTPGDVYQAVHRLGALPVSGSTYLSKILKD